MESNDITIGSRGGNDGNYGTAASSGLGSGRFLQGEAESPVSSPARSLAACDRDYRTHHHQVTVLGPVDDGLLATLEVYEALPARLDVKANAAANIGMVSLLVVCCSFFFHQQDSYVPSLDHFDVVLFVGDDTQLRQGLKQVVALQHQVALNFKTSQFSQLVIMVFVCLAVFLAKRKTVQTKAHMCPTCLHGGYISQKKDQGQEND